MAPWEDGQGSGSIIGAVSQDQTKDRHPLVRFVNPRCSKFLVTVRWDWAKVYPISRVHGRRQSEPCAQGWSWSLDGFRKS